MHISNRVDWGHLVRIRPWRGTPHAAQYSCAMFMSMKWLVTCNFSFSQVNAENFDTSHVHNELYQIFDNRWDWEVRYLHPNWSKALEPNSTIEQVKRPGGTLLNAMINSHYSSFGLQPCPDVYWFPIVTPRYCVEKVAEVENFGQWSDGSNYVSYVVKSSTPKPLTKFRRMCHYNLVDFENDSKIFV